MTHPAAKHPAKSFFDGQQFKSITLPGEGEPGWLIGANGCTSIEVTLEGDGGRYGFFWFVVCIDGRPKFKISCLHVVGLEYFDNTEQ